MIGLRRQQQRMPLILTGLIVGLGLAILVETRLFKVPIPSLAAAPPHALAADTHEPPQFHLPPLTSYVAVTARPLFSESRRPSIETASAGDAQSANFTLVGVVVSSSDRHALIEHGQPPHLERAREGQELDGWTIVSILPDRVVFRRGDRDFDLKFPEHAPPQRKQPFGVQAGSRSIH